MNVLSSTPVRSHRTGTFLRAFKCASSKDREGYTPLTYNVVSINLKNAFVSFLEQVYGSFSLPL